MEFHDCYATTFQSARQRFCTAAREHGAQLHEYVHPLSGPAGETLAADVAVFGPADASRRLLVISATHGLEGYCGSAAQLAWILEGGAQSLPPDVAVVMVHAINPWGFAHGSRTTENNVDLNRNFVDHTQPHPANPDYALLHDRLLEKVWTMDAIARAQAAMDDYAATKGADALFDALARGQYSHPDGLNYGGTQREWSNLLLEQIYQEHLSTASKIGFIDWHTGVGEYGQPFFLCFNEEDGDLFARACEWWGESRVRGQRPHGKARPSYQGLLFTGLQRFAGDTPVCGAVIEFGTRGWHMRRILRLDLWLKFHATPGTEQAQMLRADLMDAFSPVDHMWRDATVRHALQITREAVSGLAAW
jgi:hypothetical protein